MPIKDVYVETRNGFLKKIGPVGVKGREDAIRANGMRLCSSHCYLAAPHFEGNPSLADDPATIAASWTEEERQLFHESVCVFKRDSCSVAKIIGPSKSCMDVYRYMHLTDVSSVVNRNIAEAFRRRWPLEVNRGGKSADPNAAPIGDVDSEGYELCVSGDGRVDGGGSVDGGTRVSVEPMVEVEGSATSGLSVGLAPKDAFGILREGLLAPRGRRLLPRRRKRGR